MRVLVLLGSMLLCLSVARADNKVVQSFEGQENLTTSSFTVHDKWEVSWNAPHVISITVATPDGTIVAGAAASAKGSLYLPQGGTYSLQIASDESKDGPWQVSVVQLDPTLGANGPVTSDYLPPVAKNIATSIQGANAVAPAASTATDSTNAAPVASDSTNAAASSAPVALTEDQARAIVVIKGDVGEGTGFLIKTPDGPAVITNLHVLSANPNIHILTSTGDEVKTLSLKGASDRDLAMIMIQDNHYSYLDTMSDLSNGVQNGDEVITPGNSEGGEVVLNTKGKVLGIGPQKVEIDNPIYHGNSGGPIFHTASGKVIGVVTEAMKVRITNEIDKDSHDNKNSAISGDMRYFGLRLDNVPTWEPYDWNQFLTETTFLRDFHEQSRCLDSLLNGKEYEKAHLTDAGTDGPPDSSYYQRDQRLVAAYQNMHDMQADADQSGRIDAVRQIVMDLDGFADANMTDIQNPANFYSFDQQRAADEVKYRQWLRDEVDKIGDKISDLGH